MSTFGIYDIIFFNPMILQMGSMVSRDVMSFLKLMLSVVPHSQTDELGLCLIQNLGTGVR